jgi:hypothetical protein
MPPKIKRSGETVRRARRGRGIVWLLGALGAIAAVTGMLAFFAEPATTPAPSDEPARAATPPPGTRELLDGLKPGDAIGAWRIHVLRVVDRQLGIDLLHGDKVLTVWIAKKGSSPRAAPRETAQYVLYYGFPIESEAEARRDIETILNDIEARVRRSEATATVPAGM